jgi:oligopeptidase A
VSHLNSVADTPELRAAYNAALPRVTEFWTRLGADERLYAKYKAIDPATPERRAAPGAQATRCATSCSRGAELQGAAKERFAAIQERQAELSQKFSENALDATDAYAYYASAEEMDGLPADVQDRPRRRPSRGQGGYKLTLKMPCYLPVMQFATAARCASGCTAPTSPAPPTRPRATRKSSTTAPLMTRDPGAAPGRSAAAGLRQLRRGVAGAQDGRHPGR